MKVLNPEDKPPPYPDNHLKISDRLASAVMTDDQRSTAHVVIKPSGSSESNALLARDDGMLLIEILL